MNLHIGQWVLASSNPEKLKELEALTAKLPIKIIPQGKLGLESPEETGKTFFENALLKARHAAKFSELPVIADDSGLTVDALAGKPGVHSARYAGQPTNDEKNVQKLLAALDGISEGHRNAQFRCVIVALRHKYDSDPLVCRGEWAGRITDKPYGSSGFGYDPVFFDPQLCATAAELPLEIKNQVSHRAVALAKLLKRLEME